MDEGAFSRTVEDPPTCPVCRGQPKWIFQSTILLKYLVLYSHCVVCGLVRTQRPFWLDEAYASPIAQTDIGLVARNEATARLLDVLLHYRLRGKTLVDLAGGYGLLVRMLRDRGHDAWWEDPYCTNIFAVDFVLPKGHQVAAVTIIEALEHVYDPVEFLDDIMERFHPSFLVISTELYGSIPPHPAQWPYYSQETGQHVSFYSHTTMDLLAKRYGMTLHRLGFLHVFGPCGFVPRWMRILADSRVYSLWRIWKHPASLTGNDFQQARIRAANRGDHSC